MADETWKNIPLATLIFTVVTVLALLVYTSNDSLRLSSGSLSSSSLASIFPSYYNYSSSSASIFPSYYNYSSSSNQTQELGEILKSASMANNTVILTTLNEAWANSGSIVDLFLESFTLGDGTHRLLDHLVIVAVDETAYNRCRIIHKHCYFLIQDIDYHKEAKFMTPKYLKMMWKRTNFLGSVLELGYSFVFTDADIMWFRDPFPRFIPDADFQIACDRFKGRPDDMENSPNGGFIYAKSNSRSIAFYKYWNASRETYPGLNEQDILNKIKFDPFISESGFKIRFLDTAYFGGLCQPSKDLNVVCTMHVNCCIGMDRKISDLKLMLQDWRAFKSLPPDLKNQSIISWRVPRSCK